MRSGTIAILGLIAFIVFACIMSTKGALGWLIVILVMVIALLLEIMTKNTSSDRDGSNINYTDTPETSKTPVQSTVVKKAKIESPISKAEIEAARKEAQLEWVLSELLRADAVTFCLQENGELVQNENPTTPHQRVIIVSVFKYDRHRKAWLPTDQFIRQGSNKAFASLFLMALYAGNSGREYWKEQQWVLQSKKATSYAIKAFAPMRLEDTERFESGMILEGKIDIAYTLIPPNPNNVDQDKWYLNAEAREANVPCKDENGNVWYQKRYFENDWAYPVQPEPKIDRLKILEEIQRIKGNSN